MAQDDPTSEDRLAQTRRTWDAAAPAFDDEPDHGLRDPAIRVAWSALLSGWLPSDGALLDMGCGTGTLSVLLSETGFHVTGADLSPAMLALAEAKARAAGQAITFRAMDAGAPAFQGQRFDAIVCRHLLWALPEPAAVLERWAELLNPGGRLVLIEGFWHTGAGLHSAQALAALPAALSGAVLHDLSGRADLWGRPVGDERYAVCAVKR